MKKLWIKLFGEVSFCRSFHTSYGDKDDSTKWYCDKCGIVYDKRLSDNDNGPK